MEHWKRIPNWAARVFGLGAILLVTSTTLSLIGFEWAQLGVVIGLLLLAVGQSAGQHGLKRNPNPGK